MPRRMWGRLSAGPHHSNRGAHGAPLQTSFSVSGRALLLSGQQQLSGSEDISRSHGQNQVPRLGQLRPAVPPPAPHRGRTPRRGSVLPGPGRRCPARSVSRAAKISARSTWSGSFSTSTKSSNRAVGPGVGVGLEGADHPPIAQALGGGPAGPRSSPGWWA